MKNNIPYTLKINTKTYNAPESIVHTSIVTNDMADLFITLCNHTNSWNKKYISVYESKFLYNAKRIIIHNTKKKYFKLITREIISDNIKELRQIKLYYKYKKNLKALPSIISLLRINDKLIKNYININVIRNQNTKYININNIYNTLIYTILRNIQEYNENE